MQVTESGQSTAAQGATTQRRGMADGTKATAAKILVVEDGPGEREALARLLRMESYDVVTAGDVDRALPFLRDNVDLVISDLRMHGRSGLELMQAWRETSPRTPFIIISGYG